MEELFFWDDRPAYPCACFFRAEFRGELDRLTLEMVDFENTIKEVIKYAGDETLIIILADHETGGFAINGGSLAEKKMNIGYTTKQHTGTLIPVFARGPGAENFAGIYDNTDIFKKLEPFISGRRAYRE